MLDGDARGSVEITCCEVSEDRAGEKRRFQISGNVVTTTPR